MDEKNNYKSEEKYTNYDDIQVSTQTVIIVSNLIFNLNLLYNYLPITEYIIKQKKRGRKKKIQEEDPNKNIKKGSIIYIQNRTNFRGSSLKKKKLDNKFFRNSLSLIMIISNNKVINMKITQLGKFQVTGCKDKKHYIEAIVNLFNIIKKTESYIGEKMYTCKNNEDPKFIFNIVMKNKDFKLPFTIDRQKLDTFINTNEDIIFTSFFDSSISSTGVNIKVKNKDIYDDKLDYIVYKNKDKYDIEFGECDIEEFYKYLSDDQKLKMKDKEKDKKHTFLVFSTGSVIQSGSGKNMKNIYNEFMKIIINNRKEFEEIINTYI